MDSAATTNRTRAKKAAAPKSDARAEPEETPTKKASIPAAAKPRPRKTAAAPVEAEVESVDEYEVEPVDAYETVEDYEAGDPYGYEPPDPGGQWQPTPSTGQPFKVMAIIGALVIVLLAGGLVFSLLRISNLDSKNSLRNSALKAASTYGVYLSSYDYRDLTSPTSPWSEVESHATAKFKSDFEKTSGTLKAVLTTYQATATGKVVAAGLSSVSGGRAVALLFIDQTVTNKAERPTSSTTPLRVELTMLRQHGQWLIDGLQVPS